MGDDRVRDRRAALDRAIEAELAEIEALLCRPAPAVGRTSAYRGTPAATPVEMSPGVAACREMSPDVRSAVNRQNKADLLIDAAAGAADALVTRTIAGKASATSVAASRTTVSPGVAACREMSPRVRFSGDQQNKPNPIRLALRADGEGLTELQLAAIRMLLDGRRLTQIATALQIATRTLLRWRRSAAFIAELQRQYERRCGDR